MFSSSVSLHYDDYFFSFIPGDRHHTTIRCRCTLKLLATEILVLQDLRLLDRMIASVLNRIMEVVTFFFFLFFLKSSFFGNNSLF